MEYLYTSIQLCVFVSCIILCAESFTEQAPCQPSLVYQGRRSAVFKVLQKSCENVCCINESYTCQCVIHEMCTNVDISGRQGEPSVPSSCYQSPESTTYCTAHCHHHHHCNCPHHPRWWAGEGVEGVPNDRQDHYSHEEEKSVKVRERVCEIEITYFTLVQESQWWIQSVWWVLFFRYIYVLFAFYLACYLIHSAAVDASPSVGSIASDLSNLSLTSATSSEPDSPGQDGTSDDCHSVPHRAQCKSCRFAPAIIVLLCQYNFVCSYQTCNIPTLQQKNKEAWPSYKVSKD